jgi:hypothetical protein
MKFFKIILALFLFIGIERFCHYQTKGFSLSRIVSDLPYHAEWDAAPLKAEEEVFLESILDQKFTFLGSGGSFYTFASQDQNYVIKFFKMHHLNPQHWFRASQRKLDRVFNSCKLAYDDLREETAVTYIHLNKTKNRHKTLIIIDNLGIEHPLNLDSMEFVVQKKAALSSEYLCRLLRGGQIEEAKNALAAVWHLMETITLKGYDDHDMNIETNFGFINGKPVKIDIGPFKKDDRMKNPHFYKKRLLKPAKKIEAWLNKNYPDLSDHFKELKKGIRDDDLR